jgi:hypothetical protein
MSDRDAALKVLSVVGAGRSGTTVLASILGEIEGFTSAGELRWLWERGVRDDRPCACGLPPTECPVWAGVVKDTWTALGDRVPTADVDAVVAAQHEVAARRNLPRLINGVHRKSTDWRALETVRTVIGAACFSLAAGTGAHVVVDTSKRPADAAVLAGLRDVDHYVLHIVRDPRAVVHSWRRPKTFTTGGQTRTMGTRSLPSTVRRWWSSGLWTEALRRRLPDSHWMHLRYEDFAAQPRLAIEELMSFMGESGAMPFVDDHTVRLGPNHIVAGNPSRFTTGAVTIRADEEWRRQMSRRDRILVSGMTMPLMRRYGYAGRRSDLEPAPAPDLPS